MELEGRWTGSFGALGESFLRTQGTQGSERREEILAADLGGLRLLGAGWPSWLALALLILLLIALVPLRIRAQVSVNPMLVRATMEIWPVWGFPVLALSPGWRRAANPDGQANDRLLRAIATLRRGHEPEQKKARGTPMGVEAGPNARSGTNKGTGPSDANQRYRGSRGRHPSGTGTRRPGLAQMRPFLGALRHAVRVIHLSLDATLGTGDAATTALACGLTWSVVGSILPAFPGLSAPATQIQVRPDYRRAHLDGRAGVELATSVWRLAELALLAGWMTLWSRVGARRASS